MNGEDRNQAIYDPAIVAETSKTFKERMDDIMRFVEQGEKFKKLYPHGITKIHLSVKAYGVDFSVEIDGPDHA